MSTAVTLRPPPLSCDKTVARLPLPVAMSASSGNEIGDVARCINDIHPQDGTGEPRSEMAPPWAPPPRGGVSEVPAM
jgi:hypothetical protein